MLLIRNFYAFSVATLIIIFQLQSGAANQESSTGFPAESARAVYAKAVASRNSRNFSVAATEFRQAYFLDNSFEEAQLQAIESLLMAQDYNAARQEIVLTASKLKVSESLSRLGSLRKIAQRGRLSNRVRVPQSLIGCRAIEAPR